MTTKQQAVIEEISFRISHFIRPWRHPVVWCELEVELSRYLAGTGVPFHQDVQKLVCKLWTIEMMTGKSIMAQGPKEVVLATEEDLRQLEGGGE